MEAKTEGRTGDFKLVKPPVSFSPALIHNSKGLPIRPVKNWITFIEVFKYLFSCIPQDVSVLDSLFSCVANYFTFWNL